ncbi:hypothetical protein Sjap_005204 [Stephania japonica]|uniref:Uncharacterized protein n=1 Tax=Stephania japonica TaxID=461633 RepID=A0AAP0PLM1_9MAGN
MGEKWRRVDDEEDDDEMHLNIQEVWTRKMTQGRWWSRGNTTACGGAAFQSPPLETAGGAPLGSPTTMGCEEEGEKGWFPPPLLPHYCLPNNWPEGGDPPTSRWDPSSGVRAGGRFICLGMPDRYLGLVQVSGPSGGLGRATDPRSGEGRHSWY